MNTHQTLSYMSKNRELNIRLHDEKRAFVAKQKAELAVFVGEVNYHFSSDIHRLNAVTFKKKKDAKQLHEMLIKQDTMKREFDDQV